MKQFSSQFKKQAESIRMRASERRELKERLVSYMEYHPLPSEMRASEGVSKKLQSTVTSEPFFAFNFNTTYFRNFSGVFVLIMILAVPVIAEKSLPGDVLYPVKVQFTEEVRASLSFTPFAKVEWETERLERRISEARLLASEGKLTEEIQKQFAEAIKSHADSAQRGLALLKESDSDKAAIAQIAFASALEVQSEVLGGTKGEPGLVGEDTAILAVATVVNQARTSVELAQGTAPVAYENILAAVESESTQVYELFTSVRKEASVDEIVDIERRLTDVKRKVSDARGLHDGVAPAVDAEVTSVALLMNGEVDVKDTAPVSDDLAMKTNVSSESEATNLSAGSTSITMSTMAMSADHETQDTEALKAEATILLTEALTDIQKLINYLTNIEVRESVSVETLVPVTPTAGERANEIKKLYDDSKSIIADAEKREVSSKLRNKVRYGKEKSEEHLADVLTAMSAGNLSDAKQAVEEAHAIATDLKKMVANEPFKLVEDVNVSVENNSDVAVPESNTNTTR